MTNLEIENLSFEDTNPVIGKFKKKLLNPFLQPIFFLIKLPAVFFMGIKVIKLEKDEALVTVPYAWRSQNPFKSIYFAAQAAAAELSTGVLVMRAIQGHRVSMLVVDMKSSYGKKAITKATFACKDGHKVIAAIKTALKTGEGVTVALETIGTQLTKDGKLEEVSRFEFTWSFKVKK